MSSVQTIEVHTAPAYEVTIGAGLLRDCGARLKTVLGGCRIAVVADSNVAPLYLETVCASLRDAGFAVCSYVFPAGEAHKNFTTLSAILEFLAESQLTRTDCVAALGGGVTGDMAGFAAASYLRGIRYVQLPTTLLSAVDSSVGGKTAVDLPTGKNLVGAFHQPRLVVCDLSLLDTLPGRELRCGAAEALKTAILFDPELFEHFRQRGLGFDRERVVAACVGHKRDVVCADERDNGRRQLLNLGHTLGHAVEACSGFSVLHGEAVAVGTCIMARLFARDADAICEAFAALGLPTDTDLPTEALALPMRLDKKRRGDALTLVVPRGVGDCTLETVPFEDFLNKLRKFRGK